MLIKVLIKLYTNYNINVQKADINVNKNEQKNKQKHKQKEQAKATCEVWASLIWEFSSDLGVACSVVCTQATFGTESRLGDLIVKIVAKKVHVPVF